MTQLDRIERKLDRLLHADQGPFTVEGAMRALRVGSDSALYRLLAKHSVKPIRRGLYARNDILALKATIGIEGAPGTAMRGETQLDRIERKLDKLGAAERRPLSTYEAMQALGLGSDSALYRVLARHRVQPLRRGVYARKDIFALQERTRNELPGGTPAR